MYPASSDDDTSTNSYLDSPLKRELWWKHQTYVPVPKCGKYYLPPPSPVKAIKEEGQFDRDLRKQWTEDFHSRKDMADMVMTKGGDVFDVIGEDKFLDLVTMDRPSQCGACMEGKPYDCLFFWEIEPLLEDAMGMLLKYKPDLEAGEGPGTTTNYHRKKFLYQHLNQQFTRKLPICCIHKIEYIYPNNKKEPVPYQELLPSYPGKKSTWDPDKNPTVVDLCDSCALGGSKVTCEYFTLKNDFFDLEETGLQVMAGRYLVDRDLETKYGGQDKVPACVVEKVDEHFGALLKKEESEAMDLLNIPADTVT